MSIKTSKAEFYAAILQFKNDITEKGNALGDRIEPHIEKENFKKLKDYFFEKFELPTNAFLTTLETELAKTNNQSEEHFVKILPLIRHKYNELLENIDEANKKLDQELKNKPALKSSFKI